jgi:hypothetical protein
MTAEIAAAAAAINPSQAAGATGGQFQAGYGVSLTDFGGFHQAMANASARLEAQPTFKANEATKALFTPFEHINTEAAKITAEANAVKAAGTEMKPSDMVLFTARSAEFMFHCQLMSSIASKTSEGLQQLFRQQS